MLNGSEISQNDDTICTSIQYSKYLEFGTSKIDARRHFQNSIVRQKPAMVENVKKALKDALHK